MPETFDYARPVDQPPPRWLGFFATVTLLFPLFLLGAVYGQWLLSWSILGHAPRPALDDPTNIIGANWMHPITLLAFVSFVPFGLAAVVLNILYAVRQKPRGNGLLKRCTILMLMYVGTFILLRADPGRVLYWWFD